MNGDFSSSVNFNINFGDERLNPATTDSGAGSRPYLYASKHLANINFGATPI